MRVKAKEQADKVRATINREGESYSGRVWLVPLSGRTSHRYDITCPHRRCMCHASVTSCRALVSWSAIYCSQHSSTATLCPMHTTVLVVLPCLCTYQVSGNTFVRAHQSACLLLSTADNTSICHACTQPSVLLVGTYCCVILTVIVVACCERAQASLSTAVYCSAASTSTTCTRTVASTCLCICPYQVPRSYGIFPVHARCTTGIPPAS